MRPAPRSALIFAAGFGTRMGELTRDRPKPLIEVAGRPLLDHALALAEAAGLSPVVNSHYLADRIAAHLAGRAVPVSHEPEILDTGGGLRAALPLLGPGAVATLNSDAVWTGANPFGELVAGWGGEGCEALLLLVPAGEASGHARGDFALAPDGRITREGPFVYTGAQIILPDRLMAIPEPAFSMNRIWDEMIARGSARGLLHRGGWCDVGRPENIALAEAMLAHG